MLEKQHSIRQERREDFSDDNDAVYAELKRQLGNQTPGDPALPRQMPIDIHVGGRRQDAQDVGCLSGRCQDATGR